MAVICGLAYFYSYHHGMLSVLLVSQQLKFLQVQYLNYLQEDAKLLVRGFLAVLECVMEQ